VRRIRTLDYIICGSELEALLLESRLIKEHLPDYNVMQRRLRNYPFVKVTMNEDFPRVSVAWEIEPDRAKYLGPFPRWYDAQEAVELIHRIFPVRKCEAEIAEQELRPPGAARSPCLNYHIKRCLGPCIRAVTRADYRRMMGTAIRLLRGQRDSLIRDMERDMTESAACLQFERAARLRDQIRGIREVISRHQFRVNAVDDNNLIAIYPSKDASSAELFLIRKGELADQKRISYSAKPDQAFEKRLNKRGNIGNRYQSIGNREALMPDNYSLIPEGASAPVDDLTQTIMEDIERTFFNASEPRHEPPGQLEADAMNIISRWLYRHRNDQSLVYIRKKRSKAETIASAAEKVRKVIQLYEKTGSPF
jgi:excinuclease UvrABC nuclease subunit